MPSRQSGGHHPPVGSPYRAHLDRCRWIFFMWELSIPKVLRKRRVSGWICCEVFSEEKHILKNKIGESTGILLYFLWPFLGKCKFWMDCSHTLRSGWPGKPVKVSFICWLSSWMPIRSLFQMPERRGLHWTIRSRDRYACPGPASSSLGSEKELALSYNNLRLAGDFKCLCIIRFSLNLYNCCHMFGIMFQNPHKATLFERWQAGIDSNQGKKSLSYWPPTPRCGTLERFIWSMSAATFWIAACPPWKISRDPAIGSRYFERFTSRNALPAMAMAKRISQSHSVWDCQVVRPEAGYGTVIFVLL